jgi:PTH1 family peptidyl-tRNA hydrolase
MEKFLLIGLGNPGEKYYNTRHNIGFRIVEALSSSFESTFILEKHGHLAQCKIKGRQVFILKPNTFMNLSGQAVRYYLKLKKIKLDNLLVIADDLHLPFGTIKIRRKGSDGGHNGHKDIIHKLSTSNYCRLKFGIGLNFKSGQQSNYVLNSWTEEEEKMLTNFINVSVNAIINFCTLGVDQTMAEFNSL